MKKRQEGECSSIFLHWKGKQQRLNFCWMKNFPRLSRLPNYVKGGVGGSENCLDHSGYIRYIDDRIRNSSKFGKISGILSRVRPRSLQWLLVRLAENAAPWSSENLLGFYPPIHYPLHLPPLPHSPSLFSFYLYISSHWNIYLCHRQRLPDNV